MKNVILTKLSDDRFNGSHPNGINEGYIKKGIEIEIPTIGDNYWVGGNWRTSPVTEIIDENTFKTLNSTYKIEYET